MIMNAHSSQPADESRAQPLQVAERCWMIGYRNPRTLLQCNTYLRIFPGARRGSQACRAGRSAAGFRLLAHRR
jgi:hypothetical protein